MLIKRRFSVVLASACLFSVLASSAVLAQDVVADSDPATDVVAPDPAVAMGTSDPAVDGAVPDPDVDLAAVTPKLFEAAKATLAIPAPNEPTGYEGFSDDGLAETVANYTLAISEVVDAIAFFSDPSQCGSGCGPTMDTMIEQRDIYQDILDHLNEEIRRRQVVDVTPDPTPVTFAAPASARDVSANATPPRGYCAALAAKGDYSDCGWRYRQSQKQ